MFSTLAQKVSKLNQTVIQNQQLISCMVEKPGPDANAGEIMAWMEESWTEALTEGIKSTIDEDEDEEESESE